ncbi:MAG: tRNA lysidine(34) synthetase TilS [Candidatus Babeliales bacterium]
MNKLFQTIKNYSNHYTLIPDNATIIVGLSGGPDSVFLLLYLTSIQKEKNLRLIAAHLDHAWRDDSKKDEQFCATLAKKLKIDYLGETASNLAATEKFDGSKEEFGRRLRRKFFESVAKKHSADAIALAHHLDDQEETFFIRLIRGTSLAGLSCMKPKAGLYIRPLLEIRKEDIVAWLDTNSITYCIDPTNITQNFLRNRIRSQVIPALRECDARFDHNFLNTLLKLQDADRLLNELTKTQLNTIQEDNDAINLKQFFTFDPYLQKRIIMAWLIQEQAPFTPQESFLNEILRFLEQPGSKTHQMHETWSIKKEKEVAWIIKN